MESLAKLVSKKMTRWAKILWFPLLAACLSFGLLQIDGIERSFLGAPDREMLQAAFKLRDGVARGSGDPVLWLDLDYDTLVVHAQTKGRASPVALINGSPPSASMPRGILAAALAFSRKPQATLVVLDVDIGWAAPDPEGEAQLEAQLKLWSADPTAPLLILAREILTLPSGQTLTPTRFDELVSKSPNIAYGGVSMASGNGGVREFIAHQCFVSDNKGPLYLPSVVAFAQAAQAAHRDLDGAHDGARNQSLAASIKAKVINDLGQNPGGCGKVSSVPTQNGVVSWHIGYVYPSSIRSAAVSAKWPHQNMCNLSGPPLSATRISFADILPDPLGAQGDPLCRRMVIIGGDNALAKDRTATPVGMLPGPIVLANAMRGHFDTGPILRENWSILRIGLQVALLIACVVCIVFAFEGVAGLRMRLLQNGRPHLGIRFALVMTHPLCFKFVVAFMTFGVGVLVTAISLELGFWGLLSAPAYVATLYEAWRQINADRESS